jgi:hypothetical protein
MRTMDRTRDAADGGRREAHADTHAAHARTHQGGRPDLASASARSHAAVIANPSAPSTAAPNKDRPSTLTRGRQ